MAERELSELWAPDDGTGSLAGSLGMVHTQMRRATYYRGEKVIAERIWLDHGLFESPTLIGADYDRVAVLHLWRKPAPPVKLSLREWLEASKWSDDDENEEQSAAIDRAIELLEKLAPDELR